MSRAASARATGPWSTPDRRASTKFASDGGTRKPSRSSPAVSLARVARTRPTFACMDGRSPSAATAAACERRLTLYESLTVRSPASSSGWPKPSPTRSPASENDLDSVRRTRTFESRPTTPSAWPDAKSTYASSTTSTPATSRASASTSASGTSVPEGEFGLQRKVTRARARPSAGGSPKSSPNGTWTAWPPCTATSVS